MESILGKSIYKCTKLESSKINIHGRSNCCFISSFQIQMSKHFPDFPDLKTLLNLLYPNQTNVYTHFVYDFPVKWFKLREYLIGKNSFWQDRLDKILLQICLPHKISINKCIHLTYINLNLIKPDQIAKENYESLEASLSDNYDSTKTIISIEQNYNHFEPVNIDFFSECETVKSIDEIGVNADFFM
jgi:hypothetical protein